LRLFLKCFALTHPFSSSALTQYEADAEGLGELPLAGVRSLFQQFEELVVNFVAQREDVSIWLGFGHATAIP
jgi:hypothetical protein